MKSRWGVLLNPVLHLNTESPKSRLVAFILWASSTRPKNDHILDWIDPHFLGKRSLTPERKITGQFTFSFVKWKLTPGLTGSGYFFLSSCWSTRDHIGRSTGNSNPVMTSSAGPVPRIVQTTGSVHNPSQHCPIANSASTQRQQPV